MDPWGREEEGEFESSSRKGLVARVGLTGFVKQKTDADAGPSGKGTDIRKVEVVPSKKIQRAAKMEMENKKREMLAPRASNDTIPPWEGTGPSKLFVLHVLKEGQKLQDIQVTKELNVIGRHETADVVLNHASISRQHAAFRFDRRRQEWLVEDLGSVHGTFLNKQRLPKGKCADLVDGSELRFGASTRTYIVSISQSRKRPAVEDISGSKRTKARVRFADESDGGELDQVIGYSDGAGFAVNVGPTAAAEGETGMFETSVAGTRSASTEQSAPRGLSAKLQQAVDDARALPSKRVHAGGGLYDEIPPSKGD